MEILIADGKKFNLWKPKDEEKEFHPLIKENYKHIFGEDSIYFDVKHHLRSVSGIGSIPDAYVINLSRNEWYVVENELSTHPIYDHIVKQLTKFINGIENPRIRSEIVETLYNKINEDLSLRSFVEKHIASKEIHRFLSKLVSKNPKIVVIIDEKTREVEEACKALKYPPIIIEFKTYIREDAETIRAHIFKPLFTIEKLGSRQKKEVKRELPDHYRSWEAALSWTSDHVREVVQSLTRKIVELGDVTHKPLGRFYCFYKGKPGTKSIFAALMLRKNALKVRIRTDPSTFQDPRKWTGDKVYKGWFFKSGEEREFEISKKEQIDYAIELIRHSYKISG